MENSNSNKCFSLYKLNDFHLQNSIQLQYHHCWLFNHFTLFRCCNDKLVGWARKILVSHWRSNQNITSIDQKWPDSKRFVVWWWIQRQISAFNFCKVRNIYNNIIKIILKIKHVISISTSWLFFMNILWKCQLINYFIFALKTEFPVLLNSFWWMSVASANSSALRSSEIKRIE